MTDLRQAAQQALEALIDAANVLSAPMFADAVDALKAALMQQAEPVAWDPCFCHDGVSLQIVSGGAAPEGYLGKVTLLIDGEYVDYVKVQPEQQAEPVGYWDGEFSGVSHATLYEVPQRSVFGRKYRNVPLYTAPPQRKPLTDGWQPIETAPKEEVVLLSLPLIGNIREGDRRVYEGRWHEAQATWTSVNGFLLLSAATDWMPLPQPPVEAAHGIKEGT